ncbi:MAG: hypothetical protein LOD94_15095, partial [Gammaproteobacteria bacterium]
AGTAGDENGLSAHVLTACYDLSGPRVYQFLPRRFADQSPFGDSAPTVCTSSARAELVPSLGFRSSFA